MIEKLIGNKLFLDTDLLNRSRFELESKVHKIFKTINDTDVLIAPLDLYCNIIHGYDGWELPKPTTKLKNGVAVVGESKFLKLKKFLTQLGIAKIFYPHKNVEHDNCGFTVMPIGCPTKYKFNDIYKKDLLYSFVGFKDSHPIRQSLEKFQCEESKIIFRDEFFKNSIIIENQEFYNSDKKRVLLETYCKLKSQEKEMEIEYIDIMSRSKFSLCPRGIAYGSLRFWESLKAGSIPILIADGLYLPQNWNWNSTILRISEDDIKNAHPNYISDLIKCIPKSEVLKMSYLCKLAYEKFAGSGLKTYILNNI